MSDAVEHKPVEYMARSRDYYRGQGYKQDYVWAHFDDVPFARLARPLAECTVALITTSSPNREATAERFAGRMEVFSGETAEPPASLYTEDLSWDKEATHTDDLGSYFPLAQLQQLAAESAIGAVARRYHCVPTLYSHRATLKNDAPLILSRCVEDGVDAAVLVPL